MRIAITGANGQLGTDLVRVLRDGGHDVVPWTHEEIELADGDCTQRTVQSAEPDAVIHTAAMHNVDDCEADPIRAFQVNALGSRDLARACEDAGAWLIGISTDYVFDGDRDEPYREGDCPRPLNAYGITKLAGEAFALASASRCTVMRVSGLYGWAPCRAKGLNFVDLMCKLGREREEVRVVDNETVTPTLTLDIARQVEALLASPVMGVVHATAEGQCTWHEFAAEIFRLANLPARLNVAGPDEFPAKVPRPAFSVLENARLKTEGLNRMRHWKEGLKTYLEGREKERV